MLRGLLGAVSWLELVLARDAILGDVRCCDVSDGLFESEYMELLTSDTTSMRSVGVGLLIGGVGLLI